MQKLVYRERIDETDRQRGYREDARLPGEIGAVLVQAGT